MSKSVWLLLVLAWFGLRGRPVQAADDLLFENVTWGPVTPGFAFAPPTEVWAEIDKEGVLAIGYADKLSVPTPFAIIDVTPILEQGNAEVTVINKTSNIYYFMIVPHELGDIQFRVHVVRRNTEATVYDFSLTVHVLEHLPPNLKVNVADKTLLDYIPVQVFLVDEQGRKYLSSVKRPTPTGQILMQPSLIVPSGLGASKLPNETFTYFLDEQNRGSVTIVHQPAPTFFVPGQQLLLRAPIILSQPQENARLTWALKKPTGVAVATVSHLVNATQTVSFSPEQVALAQTISMTLSFSTTNLNYPASPLQPITPLAATPLFGGSVSLQTLATQAVRLPALWPALPIQAMGSWQLSLTVSSDLPVPYYLELGTAFANQQVTPSTTAQLAGRDNQMLALSEAALVILPTTRLLAGRYAVTIHFLLVRGPSSFQ
ncbi:hypothetical protein [Lacticaseibacillus salsurivasis]|uniref:hypothetical protein n=1 Tax=Lacticaseibacillus salsurivasis TaxID=3081441 RepID=UPI0030C6EF93